MMDPRTRVSALVHSRQELLSFCESLTEDQWQAASHAEGWSVQDVVAHLGSGCHAMFTPAALTILRGTNIERTNDDLVEVRRTWSSAQVLHEYETWSRRMATLARAVAATPAQHIPVRLAELGRFPAGLLLTGALVFDHHTHLRFDIAPAVGRELPAPEPTQLAASIEWMNAVLGNQIRAGGIRGLVAPLTLELRGRGGSTWALTPDGVRPGTDKAAATIVGHAEEFPEWATRRAPWRDRNIELLGDADYAATILDQVNVV
jgi:uncharacterized protein (TIGR03083 family)